jgi:uncharacterized protein
MKRYLIIFLAFFSASSSFSQFIEEEKTLTTATGELKGTMLLPQKGKKYSIVLIQAGSGPTDRNGNIGNALKANTYRLIAEALAKKNIATLLMDKRGIAKSMKAMKAESELRFEDYSNDLFGWIKLAKQDTRIGKIFIAGHSEGSLVGMLAAQKEKVDGYISIAGAGEPIDKIIVWQVAQQSKEGSLLVDSLFTRMKNDQKIDTVPPFLMSIFRPSVQPYISSWIKYNPCTEITKLTIPVLIIQGSNDIQVTISQAENLRKCLPKAQFKIIDGMSHILKQAPLDRAKNAATYTDTNLPLMPGLVDILENFILQAKDLKKKNK